MTDDTWPDLSGWYPLPEGGTIPKGMRYAQLDRNGEIAVDTANYGFTPSGASPYSYRTERPISTPLPTEEGARIIAYGPWLGMAELALTKDGWRTYGRIVPADSIIRWMPATEWRER